MHIVYVCVSAGAMIFPISLVVSEIVGYISACETEEEEKSDGERDKDMSLVRV